MNIFFQLFFSGIALGSVYAAIALGFVLVYKSASILNFAQGDFVMLAIYLAIMILVGWGMHWLPGLAILLAAMALLGVLVHYLVARPLVGRPFFSLVLATIGLGMIIRAVVILTFGVREQSPLRILPAGVFRVGDVTISVSDVWTLGLTILTVVAFVLFFRFTNVGLRMRAVADDLEAATIVGINVDRIFAVAWVICMIVCAIGGVLYANFTSSIDLTITHVGLFAIPAAIIGGVTSVPGAIVGGMLLGLLEQIGSGYLGAEWRDLFAFGALFIVLMIRPQGLFGQKEVQRV